MHSGKMLPTQLPLAPELHHNWQDRKTILPQEATTSADQSVSETLKQSLQESYIQRIQTQHRH